MSDKLWKVAQDLNENGDTESIYRALRENAAEADMEAAHAEALLTEASRVLDRVYQTLMISPLGFHQRGAASKAFSILMDNLGIVTWAWDQDYAKVCHPRAAALRRAAK